MWLQVNLHEQGQLLRQAEFIVSHGRKRSLRHVFLFEELIIFSKTRHSPTGHDVYIYKHSIKVYMLSFFIIIMFYFLAFFIRYFLMCSVVARTCILTRVE